MTSRKQQNQGRFIFHGEGGVWLLLNTFHVFLIVKIQYSLKDQSTTGQILFSDAYFFGLYFSGIIWNSRHSLLHRECCNLPLWLCFQCTCASGAAGLAHNSQRSRQNKRVGLVTSFWVFSCSVWPQVRNPSCLLLSTSAEAAPPHSHAFHSLSPPTFLSHSFTFINKIPHFNHGGTRRWGVLPPTKLCGGQQVSPPAPVMPRRGPAPSQMLLHPVSCWHFRTRQELQGSLSAGWDATSSVRWIQFGHKALHLPCGLHWHNCHL